MGLCLECMGFCPECVWDCVWDVRVCTVLLILQIYLYFTDFSSISIPDLSVFHMSMYEFVSQSVYRFVCVSLSLSVCLCPNHAWVCAPSMHGFVSQVWICALNRHFSSDKHSGR